MPSKVTASPAAPQRAHSKTKSSECLQSLIQRPLKPKTAVGFDPFPSNWAHNGPTHFFDPICIFIYQLPDFLKSVSTAPYGTAKLSILRLFTSQRGEHTAWRGLPSFIYPKSPGISTLRSQCLLPCQWQHLNLHPPGYEFTALCQMATPNRDQGRDPSTISGCFKCPRLMAQHLSWLTIRQWDKSQRFHCLTDFS